MSALDVLQRVADTIASRRGADPKSSYVASLYAKGTDSICKKIAEEAAETIMAAKDGDAGHVVREVADVWFHTLVLLSAQGVSLQDVLDEFARREGRSGIEEKLSRNPAEPNGG